MTGSNLCWLQLGIVLHVVLICQDELVALQKQLEEREQELRRLKEQGGAEVMTLEGSQSRERGLCYSNLLDQNSLICGKSLHILSTLFFFFFFTTLDN